MAIDLFEIFSRDTVRGTDLLRRCHIYVYVYIYIYIYVRGSSLLCSQVKLKKRHPPAGLSFGKVAEFSLCHVRDFVCVMYGI